MQPDASGVSSGQLGPSLRVERCFLFGDYALCVAELLVLLELELLELPILIALAALAALKGEGRCSRDRSSASARSYRRGPRGTKCSAYAIAPI